MQIRAYIVIMLIIILGVVAGDGLVRGFIYSEDYLSSTFDADFTPVTEMGAYSDNLLRDEDGEVVNQYHKIDESIDFPKVTAKAYLVADLDTGELIEGKNIAMVYPIASISKLMTALVSVETIDQYSQINVTHSAVDTLGKQGSLRSGEIFSANELMYPLLLESSNDAAEAIAEFAGYDSFIENMNKKAQSLGLSNTSFEDASGLSSNNVSTVADLFKLTSYILDNHSEIISITDKRDIKIKQHTWFNISKFINDKDYFGGKNGYTTAAKHTLITLFELPLSDLGDRRIAIILLQADKTEKDTRDIMFYLLRNIVYYE